MKVKKFVASSMPEAMKMIRAELGNDAVILNSKVVHKKGFLGLFSRKNIEVIAAVDPKQATPPVQQIKEKRKECSFGCKRKNAVLVQPCMVFKGYIIVNQYVNAGIFNVLLYGYARFKCDCCRVYAGHIKNH